MAYTIVKSDGTILTSIPDGTINTTSTSLGLPGRNYAGYGEALDTNFVHVIEHFADDSPPPNPLRGQLWCDTSGSAIVMKVCPADGTTNAQAWLTLASTSASSATTFGAVSVTGNISSNNMVVTNDISATLATMNSLEVSSTANISSASITSADIGTTNTSAVTAGGTSSAGTLTGVWTANGSGTANGVNGTAMWITGGNLVISSSDPNVGIRTDKYYYANGNPISFAGTYSNSNVDSYLPVANVNMLSTQVQTPILTTGANTTAGTITGNWSLSTGSRLNATYADLAERFAADAVYAPGTVVQIGGTHEVTMVKDELSEEVFGVVSNTAAYLMNSTAGESDTHPAIALAGRVQVKTIGKVAKGQRLVSAGNGLARAANNSEATAFNVIGRALADKTTEDEGFVEAIVMIR